MLSCFPTLFLMFVLCKQIIKELCEAIEKATYINLDRALLRKAAWPSVCLWETLAKAAIE